MAKQTKAELKTKIGTNFPDNTSADITPSDLRGVTENIVDSMRHVDDMNLPGLLPNVSHRLTTFVLAGQSTDFWNPIPIGGSIIINQHQSNQHTVNVLTKFVRTTDDGVFYDFYVSGGESIEIPSGDNIAFTYNSNLLRLPGNQRKDDPADLDVSRHWYYEPVEVSTFDDIVSRITNIEYDGPIIVSTDDVTLEGTGTVQQSLKVKDDGISEAKLAPAVRTKLNDTSGGGGNNGLTSVSVETPITGDGTSGNPLGIDDASISRRYIGNAAIGTNQLGTRSVTQEKLDPSVIGLFPQISHRLVILDDNDDNITFWRDVNVNDQIQMGFDGDPALTNRREVTVVAIIEEAKNDDRLFDIYLSNGLDITSTIYTQVNFYKNLVETTGYGRGARQTSVADVTDAQDWYFEDIDQNIYQELVRRVGALEMQQANIRNNNFVFVDQLPTNFSSYSVNDFIVLRSDDGENKAGLYVYRENEHNYWEGTVTKSVHSEIANSVENFTEYPANSIVFFDWPANGDGHIYLFIANNALNITEPDTLYLNLTHVRTSGQNLRNRDALNSPVELTLHKPSNTVTGWWVFQTYNNANTWTSIVPRGSRVRFSIYTDAARTQDLVSEDEKYWEDISASEDELEAVSFRVTTLNQLVNQIKAQADLNQSLINALNQYSTPSQIWGSLNTTQGSAGYAFVAVTSNSDPDSSDYNASDHSYRAGNYRLYIRVPQGVNPNGNIRLLLLRASNNAIKGSYPSAINHWVKIGKPDDGIDILDYYELKQSSNNSDVTVTIANNDVLSMQIASYEHSLNFPDE